MSEPTIPSRPSNRLVALVLVPWVLVGVLGGVLLVVMSRAEPSPSPGPAPAPPALYDELFVPVGRQYVQPLCDVYAGSLEAGAKVLEAGQPIASGMDTQAKAWESGRIKAFDQYLKPGFAKVLAEGTAEADISAEQRASLARAWRGVAVGMREEVKK